MEAQTRHPSLMIAAFMAVIGTAAPAQSTAGSVTVQPGYFCYQNKCVRFSNDLRSVSIQGRRPASIASLSLSQNPVISSQTFREIFLLALRQGGVNGNRG